MAITIVTTPDSHVSARRPVVFTATSNRYDATVNAKTITSVVNAGGKARFNFAGATTFIAGDIVTGITFTETSYNIRMTVTDTAAGYVTTDVDYVSDDTGTVTRTNDNFRLKSIVTINAVEFASKVTFPDSVGTFTIDIQNIILGSMTSQDRGGFVTGIATGLTNTVKSFSVNIYEYYSDVDGLLIEKNTIASSTYQAVNGAWQHIETDMADYVVGTDVKKFLTDIPSMNDSSVKVKLKTFEIYNLSFILRETMSIKYAYQRFLNGASISSHVSGTYVLTSIFNILTFSNLFGTGDRIDIWLTTTGGTQLTEKVTLMRDYSSCETEKRVKWRNRRGGYDSYTFIDFEESISADKEKYKRDLGYSFAIADRGTKVISSESAIDGEMITEYVSSDVQNWLQELINSEDVYFIQTINGSLTEVPIDILTKEHPIISQEFQQFQIKYQYANEIL